MKSSLYKYGGACFVLLCLCYIDYKATHTHIADETGHLYINRHALL